MRLRLTVYIPLNPTISDYVFFFSVKSLVGGRTYYFRVVAYSLKSFENSEEIKFPVPARVKHKAITAGVVGGLLFFIVAIILSVCAVKICNKRKRRKHEKGMNNRQRVYVNYIYIYIPTHAVFISYKKKKQITHNNTDGKRGIFFQLTIWLRVELRTPEMVVNYRELVKCL